MKRQYSVERTSKSVVTLDFSDVGKGFEQWFLLTSDLHWDNPHCDRERLKCHLEEAKEKNAGIMDAGDLFCAMQGRDDKRGNKGSIKPEHNTSAYFDVLTEDAANWFKPWAHQFVFIAPGKEHGIHYDVYAAR